MIKKVKNKFILENYEKINEIIVEIINYYKSIIVTDSQLRTSYYEKYEMLIKMLAPIKISESFTEESLVEFYNYTSKILENFRKIPKKLEKLKRQGYSSSVFSDSPTSLSLTSLSPFSSSEEREEKKERVKSSFSLDEMSKMSVENKILHLQLHLPTIEDYSVLLSPLRPFFSSNSEEKGEKTYKKLKQILLKNKCFDLIVFFKFEDVAAQLRSEIALTPIRRKNYFILFNIQRFSLLPISNFEKIKPEKTASIIKIDYENPIVFNTASLKFVFRELEGVSLKYIEGVFQPIQLESPLQKAEIKKRDPQIIYETFDGIYFRKLHGNINDVLRGPSGIAYGYNTQTNAKLEKKIIEPLINIEVLEHIKSKNKLVFSEFISKIEKLKSKKEIFVKLEKFLFDSLKIPTENKLVVREIKLTLDIECRRFKEQLNKKSVPEFIDFLKNEKSNALFKLEQKIKIINKLR